MSRVEIVVPVHNEEHVVAENVTRLEWFLAREFPFETTITVVDNASVDETLAAARSLGGVKVIHLDEKGRGRALRAAWSESDAEVVAYMDVDLSTDLSALAPLVAPLLTRDADVAIGSRLAPGAHTTRSIKRELISRAYNRILHTALDMRTSDAQCGFKAGRRDVIQALLPRIEDNHWFFDTELLCLAERNGLRIHEVPVEWVEDRDSRVKIVSTAIEDLKGVARLRRSASARRAASAGRPTQPSPVSRAG
jgi:glycosyltransferase involved in cell wall biosynthesis